VSTSVLRVAVQADDPALRAPAVDLLHAAGWTVVDDDDGGPAPDATVLVLGEHPPDTLAVKALCEDHPGGRVIAVVPADRPSSELRKLLRAGVDAVLFDRQAGTCLPLAVRAVCEGQIVVPRTLRQHVLRQPLSHREKQILRLVVRGWTNRQIADELFLAESTVKTHLSSAFAKLDTHSRAEVTDLILDPDEGRGLGILTLDGDSASRVA
jgi:DNA-binding NarL/FixJ family response regulator